MALVFENWPGGIKTVSGGTRNVVKLNRPWQTDISVDPTKCPFCTGQGKEVFRYEDGWRILDNLFTPFKFHLLIGPENCWSKEQLRILGGCKNIIRALEIARNVMKTSTDKDFGNFSLGVHVGLLAGQNTTHLHYHLLKPLFSQNFSQVRGEFKKLYKNRQYIILETEKWIVTAGGFRAGQCFILPTFDRFSFSQETIGTLARVLIQVITLYNEKFLSEQGLPPDYRITMRILNGEVLVVWYVPILNQWGFVEDSAILEGQPVVLPWTHEATVKFLKAT